MQLSARLVIDGVILLFYQKVPAAQLQLQGNNHLCNKWLCPHSTEYRSE